MLDRGDERDHGDLDLLGRRSLAPWIPPLLDALYSASGSSS